MENVNVGEGVELVVTKISRWDCRKRSHSEAVQELGNLVRTLSIGAEQLTNLYMRICDLIRLHQLSDDEIRGITAPHFPAPRVSEFIKIANAPDEVYRRYRAGFIGFRAALNECRGYRLHTDDHLKRRKIRRAAQRLITLMGQGEVTVSGKKVIVSI